MYVIYQVHLHSAHTHTHTLFICLTFSVNNTNCFLVQVSDARIDQTFYFMIPAPSIQWQAAPPRRHAAINYLRLLAGLSGSSTRSLHSLELFFPCGALWHFSVVSPERHKFGSSRLHKSEIPLSVCLCMLRLGALGSFCGASVSLCIYPLVWDRLVLGLPTFIDPVEQSFSRVEMCCTLGSYVCQFSPEGRQVLVTCRVPSRLCDRSQHKRPHSCGGDVRWRRFIPVSLNSPLDFKS